MHPDSFAARYNIDQLVYFEQYASPHTAIAREKQLKGWLRVRKIALIVATNPGWRDLSRNWGKPLPPLQSADRPCPTHQPQTQVILSAAKDLSIPDAITFP